MHIVWLHPAYQVIQIALCKSSVLYIIHHSTNLCVICKAVIVYILPDHYSNTEDIGPRTLQNLTRNHSWMENHQELHFWDPSAFSLSNMCLTDFVLCYILKSEYCKSNAELILRSESQAGFFLVHASSPLTNIMPSVTTVQLCCSQWCCTGVTKDRIWKQWEYTSCLAFGT